MIKLIWISDKVSNGIFYWILKKVCSLKNYDVNGEEAEKIIEKESADFLYLNTKKPAGTDVMNRLCLSNINRLRVSVFKLKPIRSRFLKFFFPPEIIKTIAHNILFIPSAGK